MDILGGNGDLVLAVVALGAWFVIMRFILPRLGVST